MENWRWSALRRSRPQNLDFESWIGKGLWVKNIGEHRARWDAGFRSPFSGIYIWYMIQYVYIFIYTPYIINVFTDWTPQRGTVSGHWLVGEPLQGKYRHERSKLPRDLRRRAWTKNLLWYDEGFLFTI